MNIIQLSNRLSLTIALAFLLTILKQEHDIFHFLVLIITSLRTDRGLKERGADIKFGSRLHLGGLGVNTRPGLLAGSVGQLRIDPLPRFDEYQVWDEIHKGDAAPFPQLWRCINYAYEADDKIGAYYQIAIKKCFAIPSHLNFQLIV